MYVRMSKHTHTHTIFTLVQHTHTYIQYVCTTVHLHRIVKTQLQCCPASRTVIRLSFLHVCMYIRMCNCVCVCLVHTVWALHAWMSMYVLYRTSPVIPTSLHQVYAWPLLKTMFSEVLSRDEWLRVWDHIVSNHPSFLLLLAVAYLTTARQTLLKCTAKEDFEVSKGQCSSWRPGNGTMYIKVLCCSDMHARRNYHLYINNNPQEQSNIRERKRGGCRWVS